MRRLVIVAVYAAIVVMVLFLEGRVLTDQIATNAKSVSVLNGSAHRYQQSDEITSVTLQDRCLDYATMIIAISSSKFMALSPAAKLGLLDKIHKCLPAEREALLSHWSSDVEWTLRRFDNVCETLLELDAPDKLLSLTRASADAGDWPAVETGLDCIERFPEGGAWVSPFITGQLYNALGKHYQDIGDLDRAVSAFDTAAHVYPVVWADPYRSLAQILWERGAHAEAIEGLVEGLSRSVDVTATFYLWRELGTYFQIQGSLPDAACALDRALRMFDRVPSENVSEADRISLQLQAKSLDTKLPTVCFNGYHQLKGALPAE